VRNVFAIAQKELRSYFSSPMAYIVIGFFLLPFGVFFFLYLQSFVRQSLQSAQFGGAMNINQQVIRYVLQNASVIILFIMPMITMRTYSEEKRSGTIELLLTSPVSDVEIILGKFFGALGLYVAMLLVTLLYIAILFVYGNPEWRPLVACYLGLLLMGGAFLSLGLLISSTTSAAAMPAYSWNASADTTTARMSVPAGGRNQTVPMTTGRRTSAERTRVTGAPRPAA